MTPDGVIKVLDHVVFVIVVLFFLAAMLGFFDKD
jgi:hypothetical protein